MVRDWPCKISFGCILYMYNKAKKLIKEGEIYYGKQRIEASNSYSHRG